MLSERQCEVVKNRLNNETDIPLLPEETEAKILDKVVDSINPHIEPALKAFLPDDYVDCLKIAVKDGMPSSERRERISAILRGRLEEPLAEQLAGKIDVALVPEEGEERMMKVVARKIIEEVVEWTVGEVDDRLGVRLRETGGKDEVVGEEEGVVEEKKECSVM